MSKTLNGRTADHDIHDQFLNRWSPRAFTGEPLSDATLMQLFEAARWAPSAFNLQPWRFVYARRDSEHWERLYSILIEYNRMWVSTASALAFIISDRFRRKEGEAPIPSYSHSFDTGAAWGFLALQAHHMGLAAHGMTGFDPDLAYADLGVPESDYRIEAAIAIGRPTDPSVLPEMFRAREVPSSRNPVGGFVFEGRFRG